ncbi:MAG TPA: S8 family serine peptidase [Egibacteraceae bacterium]
MRPDRDVKADGNGKVQRAPVPDVLPHAAGGRMVRDLRELLLRFPEPLDPRELARRLARARLTADRTTGRTGGPTDVWARAQSDEAALEDLAVIAERVGARWASPVYALRVRGRTVRVVPLPHVLVVRVVDPQREDEVRRLLDELGAKLDTERTRAVFGAEARGSWYLRLDPRVRDAFALRRELLARLEPDCADRLGFVPAEVVGVELSFEHMPVDVPVAFEPSDNAYVQGAHWNLDRIRLTGPGTTGWDLQPGASGVTVAVLDARPEPDADTPFAAPVDLGDPATAAASPGDHGSQVVGVLAAEVDNALGVTGVAGGADVRPHVFSSWTDVELAAGIRAAVDAGADVISISAGCDAWNPAIVDQAIVHAHRHGVLICAAAQNDDLEEGVAYPASNGLVMAVGASDQQDQRVAPPVFPWGSNYGGALSLVAPGVAIPWRADARRTQTTEGTSAATPQVAGVAALVRARRPDLRGDDVRAVLEASADRSGSGYAAVPGYPSAPWSPHTGHGRLDALAALQLAETAKPIDRGYHRTPHGPATIGPIFIIPQDDCAALRRGKRPAPVLDVQPSAALAVRSLTEHAAGGTVAGSHAGEQAMAIPPVSLDEVDVFDGAGRPLAIAKGPEGLVLVRTDDKPRQDEVVERVVRCTEILEVVVRNEKAAELAALDPPPPDPLYPLGDYASFEEFAWAVLLHNGVQPWAHSGSWLHNLRHLW